MQSTEQEASPPNKRENVIFNSLSMEGAAGKVRATIDERMLCLETKTGHALDIKINSITRVHHHHTKLIPFSFAFIGFGLVWIGVRILSHLTFQIISITLGFSLMTGWLFTRKPTITIDTEIGDCHAITGNDATLLRLNTVLMRLQQGFSLSESQEGLEVLERDTEYPRSAILEMESIPVASIDIQAPESIATFLDAEMVNTIFSEPEPVTQQEIIPQVAGLFDFDTESTPITPSLPSWLDNQKPVNSESGNNESHPLIQRGRENVMDRRNHHSENPMSLFDQFDTTPPSIEYQNNYQSPQVNELQSESSYIQSNEAGRSVLPEPLPNFCSKDGFHIPRTSAHENKLINSEFSGFSSPDSSLGEVDEFGQEIESLVALARKEGNPHQTTSSKLSDEQSIQEKFPRLRPKKNLENSRLQPRNRARNIENGNLFTNMLMPAANRVASSVKEATSSISSRLLHSKSDSKPSQSTEELRNRSSETHQQEMEENFRNLAISNGGSLPDEKVRELEEIALRRKAIIEQVEQEQIEILEDFTFGDLIDSDSNKSNSGGKEGLPRLDI
jgi:hypothetical protein